MENIIHMYLVIEIYLELVSSIWYHCNLMLQNLPPGLKACFGLQVQVPIMPFGFGHAVGYISHKKSIYSRYYGIRCYKLWFHIIIIVVVFVIIIIIVIFAASFFYSPKCEESSSNKIRSLVQTVPFCSKGRPSLPLFG